MKLLYLLQDFKTAHLLGVCPRSQVWSHHIFLQVIYHIRFAHHRQERDRALDWIVPKVQNAGSAFRCSWQTLHLLCSSRHMFVVCNCRNALGLQLRFTLYLDSRMAAFLAVCGYASWLRRFCLCECWRLSALQHILYHPFLTIPCSNGANLAWHG